MALADIHTNTSSLMTDGLLRDRGLIGGEWVNAESGATFAVSDPATGETIAKLPRMGAAETRAAIDAAHEALPAWRGDAGRRPRPDPAPLVGADGRAR